VLFQPSAAASSGYSWPTFLDNLSVPPSGVKPLKMGPKVCPETSVRYSHCSLRNKPEEPSSRGMCLCQRAFIGKRVKSLCAP
jgi:hypothetical protein